MGVVGGVGREVICGSRPLFASWFSFRCASFDHAKERRQRMGLTRAAAPLIRACYSRDTFAGTSSRTVIRTALTVRVITITPNSSGSADAP